MSPGDADERGHRRTAEVFERLSDLHARLAFAMEQCGAEAEAAAHREARSRCLDMAERQWLAADETVFAAPANADPRPAAFDAVASSTEDEVSRASTV